MTHPKDRTHGTLDVPMDRSKVSLYSFDWSNWKYKPRPAPNDEAREFLETARKKASNTHWLSREQCRYRRIPEDIKARVAYDPKRDGWYAKITIDGQKFASSLLADKEVAMEALKPLYQRASQARKNAPSKVTGMKPKNVGMA